MTTRNNMIHTDQWRWTAVVYLSKPEDCAGGLSFFRHKETGLLGFGGETDKPTIDSCEKYGKSYGEMLDWFFEESLDLDKWEEINFVSCQFNRLVLFEGSLFHGIKQLFGNSKENTRLSQHFFIHEVI